MASVYEFVLELKDRASAAAERIKLAVSTLDSVAQKTSGTMQNMQNTAQNALGKILNTAKNAVKGPQNLTHSIEDLKTKLETLNKVKFSTHIKSEFDAVQKEIDKTERKIARMQQGISGNGWKSKMKGWRADFANSLPGADLIKNPLTLAGAAVGGLWSATEKAMQAGKEKVKMQTLTGSQEIGGALYDGLTKFATDTVFGNEVYDMGAQMLANGIKSSDVLPIMKQLGDISMGDAEKLGSLSLAFAQINGKGHLAGQELLQLINAGFNPLQVISEKTGESMESLMGRMEKGEISVTDVRKAFDMATGEGGKFQNMLEKVANTPYGQLEGLKGQLEQMMVKIGEVFLPIASMMMTFFSWLGEKLGPLLQPLAAILGGLSIGLLAMAAAQWVANLAVWSFPGTWIVAAIVAIIAVITYCISKISGWGEAWKIVVNNAKLNWAAFTSNAKFVWDGMVNGIMIGLNKIKEGWYKFKNAVGIGDKSENNALLQQALNDTKKRQQEIEKSKKAANAATEALKKGGKNALSVLKWNEESSLTGTVNKLQNQLGMSGGDFLNKGNAVGEKNTDKGKKLNQSAKEKSDGIVSGGSKQTNITLNIGKLNEKIEVITHNLKEGAGEIEEKMQEILLRALNSVNQMQTT